MDERTRDAARALLVGTRRTVVQEYMATTPGKVALWKDVAVLAGDVPQAARDALEYLEGVEIPYVDRHRPLLVLHELVGTE